MTAPGPEPHDRDRDRTGERGQATVEVVLVLPVVVAMVLVVLQVGLVARDRIVLINAAREGARAFAVTADEGAAVEAARRAGPPAVDRLTVTVTGGQDPGDRATVTVTYLVPTRIPLAGALLPDVALEASATMRVE
ncbi:MAG: TadE/TadG family type IV pilus assembly protein [Acidimicrobiales bacterium]